jgi:hypothetical protein
VRIALLITGLLALAGVAFVTYELTVAEDSASGPKRSSTTRSGLSASA